MRAAPVPNRIAATCPSASITRGCCKVGQGETSLAEESFRKALELQESLVAQNPGDIALQSGLAGVYNNLGIVLEGLQHMEQAAAAYQQAVDHQQIAYAHAPSVARYRSFLSKHYYNYGRVLRKMGQADKPARSLSHDANCGHTTRSTCWRWLRNWRWQATC